jgi:hypothetical protein
MDSDLVRLAGLESHLEERGVRQRLEGAHVGDRALALADVSGGAAQSISAIGDQARLDAAIPQVTVGHAQIGALDVMCAEQRLERALGQLGLGEREQTRGLLVDAVDDVQWTAGGLLSVSSPRFADEVHGSAALALLVRDAGDAARLIDHHHVRVFVGDAVGNALWGPRPLIERDHVAASDANAGIELELTGEGDLASFAKALRLRPGDGYDPATEQCRQGDPRLRLFDDELATHPASIAVLSADEEV